MTSVTVPGSFRDPSGFLFSRGGVLFRQVNESYRADYELLKASGLYDELTGAGLLIPHEETDEEPSCAECAFKVLRPERIAFISYPYEWSFSQLKDAALLTLEIQRRAVAKGMRLKDASAYNVQFHRGRPVFIDTLSFEKDPGGEPWAAYKQFCQHFMAPLALMCRADVRLSQLLRIYIDGVPLDLAASMLPASTWLSGGLVAHIHMQARYQTRYARVHDNTPAKASPMSANARAALLDNLRSTVEGLDWKPKGTEWLDYYEANNNYSEVGIREKERLVVEFALETTPRLVWDVGGNTGRFSRALQNEDRLCVVWDVDPGCIEANYRTVKKHAEKSILPLLVDLTNPSSGIGWAHDERASFAERGPADLVMALGLIHHLAISNNTPLEKVAHFFARLSPNLLIEFVPKEDSQVQKLLATRVDCFPGYTESGFEGAFGRYFELVRKAAIPQTCRSLYLMKAKLG